MDVDLQYKKTISILLLFITTIAGIKSECTKDYGEIDTNGEIRNKLFLYGFRATCSFVSTDNHTSLIDLKLGISDVLSLSITKSNIPLINNTTFNGFTRVKQLRLDNDNIADILPNSFSNMPNLLTIRLTNNKLTKINKLTFNGTTKLQNLDLSFNKLTILENINTITSLEQLKITNNNLLNINDNSFIGLSNLYNLDLSYNNLTTLDNINVLTNLTELNVTNNHISILNENALIGMKNLKILNLYNNKLSTFNYINLVGSLEKINVSSNSIEFVTQHDLQNLQLLQSLDLSDNRISNLPQKLFKNQKNLTELFLNRNNLHSFSNDLFYKSISHLDLYSNALETIQCDQMQGSVILRHNNLNTICHLGNETTSIDLSLNQITEIKNDTFKHLNNLAVLKLIVNNIKEIDVDAFQKLHNLTTLLLKNNEITTFHMGTFFQLNSLEILDISYNLINSLAIGIFTGLNNLKSLNLAHNKLEYVDTTIFYSMQHLEELYLHANPLVFLDHYSIGEHLRSLKHFSMHLVTVGCTELERELDYLKMQDVKVIQGPHMKGPNVHGITCEPEEDNSSRRFEEFLRIRGFLIAVLSLFFLIITMFVVLFISQALSWYRNQSKNKIIATKNDDPSCSLTLLTNNDPNDE